MFDDDIKVGENDQCLFYVNSWTKGVEDWAVSWGLVIKCLISVQNKDPEDKDYILMENGEVIYSDKKIEGLGVHIDMIALSRGKKKI